MYRSATLKAHHHTQSYLHVTNLKKSQHRTVTVVTEWGSRQPMRWSRDFFRPIYQQCEMKMFLLSKCCKRPRPLSHSLGGVSSYDNTFASHHEMNGCGEQLFCAYRRKPHQLFKLLHWLFWWWWVTYEDDRWVCKCLVLSLSSAAANALPRILCTTIWINEVCNEDEHV